MSMCYLCAMCKHRTEVHGWDRSILWTCRVTKRREAVAIDYGRDDPREICKHFERKEGSK